MGPRGCIQGRPQSAGDCSSAVEGEDRRTSRELPPHQRVRHGDVRVRPEDDDGQTVAWQRSVHGA